MLLKKITLSICFIMFLGNLSAIAQEYSSYFDVKKFGAKGDGQTMDTKAIQAAIDSCHMAGGGKVYLYQGTFLSGTLILKSNVTLYVEAGATLLGSNNVDDFPIQPSKYPSYKGTFVTNKAFIYAEDAHNISILGRGQIDGRGDDWIEGPYGSPSFSVRPRILHFRNCENVHVQDITLKNSASWVQSYQSCNNVVIDGITVDSRENKDIDKSRYADARGRNTDGLDLVDCQFVRISNCFINSGDDAICLKSFSPDEGCRNITISNCIVSSNASGIKLGTESSGAFEDISIQNCSVFDTRNDAIALMTVDGARMERIIVSNITARNIKGSAIFIRVGQRGRPYRENATIKKSQMKDVLIQNVHGSGIGGYGCSLTGLPEQPIKNITLNQIDLEFVGGKEPLDIYLGGEESEGSWPKNIEDIPEKETSYPGGKMFGRLPSYGFFVRHGKNIQLNNLQLRWKEDDPRPALICDDIENLQISGLKAQGISHTPALVWLQNCKEAIIRNSQPVQDIPVFLKVSGENSREIVLTGNHLKKATKTFILENGLKQATVNEFRTVR